ncbi:uncharacterized protein DS421_3g101090 [Arachis hypogaea]|nr:uncharacterized protein DS421_3g101090 [Arachis hypogaea]
MRCTTSSLADLLASTSNTSAEAKTPSSFVGIVATFLFPLLLPLPLFLLLHHGSLSLFLSTSNILFLFLFYFINFLSVIWFKFLKFK